MVRVCMQPNKKLNVNYRKTKVLVHSVSLGFRLRLSLTVNVRMAIWLKSFGRSHSNANRIWGIQNTQSFVKKATYWEIIFFTGCKVIGVFATGISAEYFLRYDRLTWNSLCLFLSQVRFIKIVQWVSHFNFYIYRHLNFQKSPYNIIKKIKIITCLIAIFSRYSNRKNINFKAYQNCQKN